jgi:predicted metal-binding membrane protein
MMTRTWDFTDQVLLFAMWAVKMIGMMLPSATPTLFLYASVIPQESAERMRPPANVYAFAAVIALSWSWIPSMALDKVTRLQAMSGR